jgi:hypothetical protein
MNEIMKKKVAARAWRWASVCWVALAWGACGEEAAPAQDTVECGEGTQEQDGQCVAVEDSNNAQTTLTCGPGTRLEGERCVPDNPRVCAVGTVDNGAGQCVPATEDTRCGVGTTLRAGQCVPIADLCPQGQAWVAGACAPLDQLCASGTLWVDGVCRPVDPLDEVAQEEPAEPNDPRYGGEAGSLPPLEFGVPARVKGVISAPQDADGDGLADPDLDVFGFEGEAGQRVRVEATAVGAPDVAFELALEDDARPFGRLALPYAGRNAHREFVLPRDGRYTIRVGTTVSVIPAPLPIEANGDESFSWILTVERITNPEPTVADQFPFELEGSFDELRQVELRGDEGTILALELRNLANNAPVLMVGEAGDLDRLNNPGFVTLGSGPSVATLDQVLNAYIDDRYVFTVSAPASVGLGEAQAGRNLAQGLEVQGERPSFARFTVSEPLVVTLEAEPVDLDADPRFVLLGPDRREIGGAAGAVGPERLQVLLEEPGEYTMLVYDELAAPSAQTVQVVVRGQGVGDFGPLALNAPARSLVQPDLSRPGQFAWFLVETERLGSLLLEATCADQRVGLSLHLLRPPILSVNGSFDPLLVVEGGAAGEPATLDRPFLPNRVVVAVGYEGQDAVGGPQPVTLEAALLNSHPVALDAEPNEVVADAVELGTLDERPTFGQGDLLDVGGGTTLDLFRFTVAETALVGFESSFLDPITGALGTVLEVWDLSGRVLADDGGQEFYGALQVGLAPGDYLLAVRGPGDQPTGGYYVAGRVLGALTCAPGASACVDGQIEVCDARGAGVQRFECVDGACVDGPLGAECAPVASGEPDDSAEEAFDVGEVGQARVVALGQIDPEADEDWYRFEVEGGLVTLGTLPDPANPEAVTDTALSLYDEAGELLAFDDNGGPGAWSLIAQTPLGAGTYLAQVRGAEFTGALGPYRLFIERVAYVCEPGAVRCMDGAVEVCDQGLAFVVQEACPETCRDDAQGARCISVGEPNNTPALAAPLDLPARFEVALDTALDQDWYAFSTDTPIEIWAETLPVEGVVANTRVFLCAAASADTCSYGAGDLARHDDVQAPSNRASKLEHFLAVPGDYFVVVESADGRTGPYGLHLREAGEPNESAAQARLVSSPATIPARIAPTRDVDWYRVDLAQAQRLVFSTAALDGLEAIDLQVWLCDAAGAATCAYGNGDLARDDNSGRGLYARLAYAFPGPGTWYLGVRSFQGARGGYTLGVTPDTEPNDLPAQASGLELPASLDARIDQARDRDWYRFEVAQGETLQIETRPIEDGDVVNTRAFLCAEANVAGCNYGAGDVARADDGVFPQYTRLVHTFAQAGTYYLGVEAVGTGVGEYELFVDESLEDDDAPEEASDLEVPSRTVRRLAPAGDQDWYAFTVEAPALLQFETAPVLGGVEADTRLFLCDDADLSTCRYDAGDLDRNDDADGAGGYSRLLRDFAEPGVYYLVVEATDGGLGHYALSASEAGEPNDSAAEATRLGIPGTGFGQLTPGDVDWFQITTAEPLELTFETQPLGMAAPADTRLWLCDTINPANCTFAQGNLDANDDGLFNAPFSRLDVSLEQPGIYYAVVESASEGGSFALSVREQGEPDDAPDEARSVTLGQEFRARVSPGLDEDWYTFTTDSPTLLEIEATPRDGATPAVVHLTLCEDAQIGTCAFDGDHAATSDDGDGDPTRARLVYAAPGAGTWFLQVTSANGQAGHYELRISEQGEPNDLPSQAGRLTLPGELQGRISTSSDVDWFDLTLPSATTVLLQTLPLEGGDELDSLLFVCAAPADGCDAFTALSRDNDNGRGYYSRLEVFLQAGQYKVGVQGFFGDTGHYKLRAELSPEPDNTPAQARALAWPTVVEADFISGADVDWLRFEVEAGNYLRFETYMIPGTEPVDTLLFLCSAAEAEANRCTFDSNNLAANDNAGGLYSRIEYGFNAPGVYYVAVKSFFSVGEYGLRVLQPDEPNDSAAEATVVGFPVERRARINREDDQDWYRLQVTAGTTLNMDTLMVVGGFAVNTRVFLCSEANAQSCAYGDSLSDNEDRNAQYGGLSYFFPTAGVYYFVVESSDGSTGDYTLRVTR